MTVGFAAQAGTPIDDDLYREIILDHYRHPRHRGEAGEATSRVEAVNPLCGDEVTLSWRADGGRIADIAFLGQGCSICMASASMLCEAVHDLPIEQARELGARFRSMLLDSGPGSDLGDLEALQGVAAYPVRIKCAILPWNALLGEIDPESMR